MVKRRPKRQRKSIKVKRKKTQTPPSSLVQIDLSHNSGTNPTPNDVVFERLLLQSESEDRPEQLYHTNLSKQQSPPICYYNRNKDKSNIEPVRDQYEILPYENKENRDKILEWLSNTQNIFEHHVLTQCEPVQSCDIFDMPSVSQMPPKCQPHLSQKRRRPSRTHSLAYDSLADDTKQMPKHSISLGAPPVAKQTLEGVETDQQPTKSVVERLEDEFLSRIGHDLCTTIVLSPVRTCSHDQFEEFAQRHLVPPQPNEPNPEQILQMILTNCKTDLLKLKDTSPNFNMILKQFICNLQKEFCIKTINDTRSKGVQVDDIYRSKSVIFLEKCLGTDEYVNKTETMEKTCQTNDLELFYDHTYVDMKRLDRGRNDISVEFDSNSYHNKENCNPVDNSHNTDNELNRSGDDLFIEDDDDIIIEATPVRPLAEDMRPSSTPKYHIQNNRIETMSTISVSPISKQQQQQQQRTVAPSSLKWLTKQKTILESSHSTNVSNSSNNKQSKIDNFLRSISGSSSNQPVIRQRSVDGARIPHVACTRVNKEEKRLIMQMAQKQLIVYEPNFNGDVTHMVAATNAQNQVRDHTIKFVAAVGAGLWILNVNWIRDSLAKNQILDEERYEVLDQTGGQGPKLSRTTRLERPLFHEFDVYVAPPITSTTCEEIENVIRMLGGRIVDKPEEFLEKSSSKRKYCIIITEAKCTQHFATYEVWLQTLKTVTVDVEWLSRSVGQYKLLNFRPYCLCSDDYLYELNYPNELINDESFTLTDTINNSNWY